MNYCISIDWFQYYCHNSNDTRLVHGTYFRGASADKSGNFHTYMIGKCEEFHSMYRESYTIYIDNAAKDFVPKNYGTSYNDFEQAMKDKQDNPSQGRKLSMVHIFCSPKMSSIDPRSVSVKVSNRLLYKEDWSWYLHDILEALHIMIKNVTRVDLCLDFQRFAYQDLTPQEFIHRYVQDQTIAKEETYVREGSNEYCIYGKKRMVAKDGSKEVNDSTEVSVLSDFEYIRFGSRNSGVCTYLYNKSKELRDKKSKPWIRSRWEEAGLDEATGDIFRLEFSISAKGMCLKKADRKKGMKSPQAKTFRRLCRDDVESQRQVEELFMGYLDKYFSFRKVGKQKYRKDMKRVQLFDFDIEPKLLPCYYNTNVNYGRAEKNAAKTLEKLQYTILDLPSKQADILYKAQQVLEALSVEIRQLKQEDIKDTYYLQSPYKNYPILCDRLVRQAVEEVESIRQVSEEKLRTLEEIALKNDDSFKEWWLSDEDGIIAYD